MCMALTRSAKLACFAMVFPFFAPAARAAAVRQPVLVELFTSEGCSSCPPADRLLENLERSQPVETAQVIVLSEHVDYWNYIGWTDPYSQHLFSTRQEMYARQFGLEGPYTPQMVVDGNAQFVGSDARKAESAIRAASRESKIGIQLTPAGSNVWTLAIDPLAGGKMPKANVYAAFAADSGTQNVARGENQGRTLRHVAIARELKQIGTVTPRAGLKSELRVPAGLRLVVFIQSASTGRVLGAAMQPAAR